MIGDWPITEYLVASGRPATPTDFYTIATTAVQYYKDYMKDFDLEKALNGHPLIRSNSMYFDGDLFDTKDGSNTPLIGKASKSEEAWTFDYRGRYRNMSDSNHNNLKLQSHPNPGEILSVKWVNYLLKIGVKLEFSFPRKNEWHTTDCGFKVDDFIYRIPPPPKKIRNKTAAELPYVFTIHRSLLRREVSGYSNRGNISLPVIADYANAGYIYSDDGINFHLFTAEE